MLNTTFNFFEDWNPQLAREIKGRLKRRNLMATIGISVVGQVLLLYAMMGVLPNAEGESNRYGYFSAARTWIDWPTWWADMATILAFVLPFLLLLGGVYLLSEDMSKEDKSGTLNFIRLSPQPSHTILWGKLLGVPSPLYLFLLTAMPLHVTAALLGRTPLALIVGYYGVIASICLCSYCTAILTTLITKGVAIWGNTGLAFMVYIFGFQSTLAWQSFRAYGNPVNSFYWFNLPLGKSLLLTQGFIIASFAIATLGVWQALNRRFRNPNTTLLSKADSYWITPCTQIFVLGFVLNPSFSLDEYSQTFQEVGSMLSFGILLVSLGLMVCLSPQRQTLLDWARYRHAQRQVVANQLSENVATLPTVQVRRRSLFLDLLWGEKSPAPLAIAVNLAIATLCLVPFIALAPVSQFTIQATLMCLVISYNLILIYALLGQLLLMVPLKQSLNLAITIVGALLIVPPVVLGILSQGHPATYAGLWMFSVFGGSWYTLDSVATLPTLLGILGQWTGIVLLGTTLNRQLQKVGASSSHALLTPPRH